MKLPILISFGLVMASAGVESQHPVVPGIERLRGDQASSAAERGAVLLGELSCTVCHAAGGVTVLSRPAPDLSKIGARVTTTWLRRFLLDPHGTKPGTLMPNWNPDADGAERAAIVESLLHYLASRGGPLVPASIGVTAGLLKRGRNLFHSIGCVACHAPDDGRKVSVSNLPLGELAHKTTVDALASFLRDPHAVRPASRMPDFRLDADEARAIAMFLLRAQIDNPQADGVATPDLAGLRYSYYEIKTGELPDFAGLVPVREGLVSTITHKIPGRARENHFALRLRGKIAIPETGAYRFFLRSDDGSRLLIDGYVVVDDPAARGKKRERSELLELTKGAHPIEIHYLQRGGRARLAVSWAGPGIGKRRIPDDALTTRGGRAMIPLGSPARGLGNDPDQVARGRSLFVELGCAACHEPGEHTPAATPLAGIDPDAGGTCLDAAPRGDAVAFSLSATQKVELRAALADLGASTRSQPKHSVRRMFAAFNCYACHVRDGIGGPEDARYNLFGTKISIDLGDEGILPPPLTGVGDKLRPKTMEKILSAGEHHIRGRFMRTRMPGYAMGPTRELVAQLVAADRRQEKATGSKFDRGAIAVGKRLVGVTGFACVTCHNVNGNRSAGIPGTDLASAHGRLNPDWFHRFMRSPSTLKPGTRMPGYWTEEKSAFADLLGGSSQKQVDAVWHYLSLGKSIPAPAGVQRPGGGPKMELFPRTEPIVHRTFMQGVGQRTIVVGFPENMHVAFDAQGVRLAKVWRGRFFDAGGVASARTQKFLGPLGGDVLDLPGPAFARLAERHTAWPKFEAGDRDVGGDFLGYTLDKARRPVFRYRIAGVDVREQPLPQLEQGGTILRRTFRVTSDEPPDDLYFRAWRGAKILKTGPATWKCGDVTVVLRLGAAQSARIRPDDDAEELVVRLAFAGAEIRFEQVVRW